MGAPSDMDVATAAALLRWHIDMGVDWAVDERPRDRFAEYAAEAERLPAAGSGTSDPADARPADRDLSVDSAAADSVAGAVQPDFGSARATPLVSPQFGPSPPSVPRDRGLSTDAAEHSARAAAESAADLDSLRTAYESFDGCALKRTASRLVFSDGSAAARLMLIGEAPGAEEDRTGRPFVGRAGQLLDRMLAAIDLDRTKVYIANVVPWRPPGNRAPTPQEVAICMPFLQRQIALVGPDLIVALGGSSAQALFGIKDGIMRARGVWRSFETGSAQGPRSIAALATLHPAYLLRSSGAKKLAWRDLREIRKALDNLPAR